MIARLFILFIVLWVNITTANAQKAATVKSFTQTTDHIPLAERRNDFNGIPCALVKVQVVDNIERVEGNRIGNVINKGVEKWVYMCKDSRNIRIHLKNNLPIKVMFKDYQINGLESNRVYELVIDAPNNDAFSEDFAINTTENIKQETNIVNSNEDVSLPTLTGNVLAIDKNVINYRFDFSQLKIGNMEARKYISLRLKEGDNVDDAYKRFLSELEQIFISSANTYSLSHKGYRLENNTIASLEVLIYFSTLDEDGEHDVYGIVTEKSSQREIGRLRAHVGGGRNNFYVQFPKRLRKTGEEFGDKLVDDIIKRIKYLQ